MRRGPVILALGAIALIAIAIGGIVHTTGREPRHSGTRPHVAVPAQRPAAAAINFLAGLTLERLVDPRAREAFLERHAAPESLARLRQEFAAEAERIGPTRSGSQRFSRAAVFGYRVRRRSAAAAEVHVWAASVGAAAGAPVAVGWRTIRVSLDRIGTRWRVVSVETAPGPTPDLPGSEFSSLAARFKVVHATP